MYPAKDRERDKDDQNPWMTKIIFFFLFILMLKNCDFYKSSLRPIVWRMRRMVLCLYKDTLNTADCITESQKQRDIVHSCQLV